jgi:hydrogenase/urease accessory protein HupE
MRKVIMLTVYLAMIAVGLWAAYDWLVFGGRGILFRASAFLALFGGYLLWIDFLSPNGEPQ